MPSFPWIPIYKELASTLLEYRARQDELIDILREAASEGCKVVSLKDKDPDGNVVPLTVVDPFTFFASFNRTDNYADRSRVLDIVAHRLNLSADVPKSFGELLTRTFRPFDMFAGRANVRNSTKKMNPPTTASTTVSKSIAVCAKHIRGYEISG